jgi:hypothetical protein
MYESDRRMRERIIEFEVRRLELRQRRERQEAGRRRALDVPPSRRTALRCSRATPGNRE